ncbi:unnamed protein product [Fraxinus pennsylvanica]|uniref:ER membrane protein complex subunit 6 n=1 Tax=Fraxinus pennsylvanica TaxID=56036 RepID=A0AAD1ZWF8_9LAMI|nr:unnamed protein product [Fraxinus pennsylvanica]
MRNRGFSHIFSRNLCLLLEESLPKFWDSAGWTGFIFYFLVMAITSIGIAAKAGFSVRPYFDSWNQILVDGFLGGLLVCLFVACIKFFLFPFVAINISENNIICNAMFNTY